MDCAGTPLQDITLTDDCTDQSAFAPAGTYVETYFVNINDIGLWQLAVFYPESNCQGSFLSFESVVNSFEDEGTGCIEINNGPYKSAFFSLSVGVPEFPAIPDNEPFTVYRLVLFESPSLILT